MFCHRQTFKINLQSAFNKSEVNKTSPDWIKIDESYRHTAIVIPQTPCVTQFLGQQLFSFSMQNDFRIMEFLFVEVFCIKLSKHKNFYSKITQFLSRFLTLPHSNVVYELLYSKLSKTFSVPFWNISNSFEHLFCPFHRERG